MWIEIVHGPQIRRPSASRPARALWIEIANIINALLIFCVEAREGLVD